MPKFIEQLGQQIGGGAAGAILGLALGGWNDKRQYNQQEDLQRLQIQGNKEMTDYAYKKQMEMWNATNYWAQVEQMRKAGLNPAMMYGMSGGGGATMGSGGGGVSGASAPVGGGEVGAMMGMGMQMQMIKAQKDLIEAQTNKTNTEANKIGGVDTKKTETEILDLTQGITNKQAIEKLTRVQTTIAELDAQLKGKTIEEQEEIIQWAAGKALYDMEMAEREAFIQKATMNNKIDQVKAELIGTYLRNTLTSAQTDATKKGIEVNTAQIAKMAQDVAQGWKQLSNAEKQIKLDGLMKGLEEEKGYDWNNVRYEYKTKIQEAIKNILNR